MEEIILEAIPRTKQPGKFRESGFVPGVLYGDSVFETASVKTRTYHFSRDKFFLNHEQFVCHIRRISQPHSRLAAKTDKNG